MVPTMMFFMGMVSAVGQTDPPAVEIVTSN
jgi:hypothetical protein